MKLVALLISGVAGATFMLAVACGGPEPTPTVAPQPTPTAGAQPSPTTPPDNGGDDPVARGQTLVQEHGCLACHSTDGTMLVAPTWQGLYGSEEPLADGTSVTVDDEYIRESIIDPNAKITEGYQPNIMPQTFEETLSDEDIDAIIAYIRSLE